VNIYFGLVIKEISHPTSLHQTFLVNFSPAKTAIFTLAKLFDADTTLKRLQNRYRLVVMNDDTYEEVVTFKLSRMSVYILLSTIFVVLTGLTVALIVFTPLKLYIPGYGDVNNTRELRELKLRADSLEHAVRYKDEYLQGIKGILEGNTSIKLDTTALNLPPPEKIND